MPRKKPHIHYIYKTTCNVTKMYYIGMHSTSNLEDGYMGSGKRLRYSIRKYGNENHTKEIIEYLTSREELIIRETEIIDKVLLSDNLCLNIKEGGQGGFISEEQQKYRSICANKALNEKLKTNEVFRLNWLKKMSEGVKRGYDNGTRLPSINLWNKGLNLSEEHKNNISKSMKGKGCGETNSQFGKKYAFINKNGINKKIELENLNQWLENDWVRGRCNKLN